MSPISTVFSLLALALIPLLPPPTTAQAEFIFAYSKPDSGCKKPIKPASLHNQGIATNQYGQCVPVHDTQNGTFDVSISGLIYWTDTVTPVIKACPTIDCDYYADNGCYTMWDRGKWPGLRVCKKMTQTYYWAVGPMPWANKRDMRHGERIIGGHVGERYNGTYANATDY